MRVSATVDLDEPLTMPSSSGSHRPQRASAHREHDRTNGAGSGSGTALSSGANAKNSMGDKMGGLALPDVVRELLRDPAVLKWHARDEVYEVMHGDNFEKR